MFELADALTKAHVEQKDGVEKDSLQVALEASKKKVLQGSMDVLLVIYKIPSMKYWTNISKWFNSLVFGTWF